MSLIRETLRWAWLRDEVQETSSAKKVVYFVVLYGGWFALMLGAGLVLQLAGYAEAASGVWFFGVGFSAFMASIDIAWEAVSYFIEHRGQDAAPAAAAGPGRELAPDFRLARDTWVGFIVTVVALLLLLGLIQVALVLS